MQRNINCLIRACENLGIDYKFVDKEKNLVCITSNEHTVYFKISITPFNLQIHAEICEDKMHTYSLLNSLVNMPKTIQFLDYNTDEKYQKYLKYKSEDAIIDKIEETFDYPLIIKQNRGSLGINVYLCPNQKESRNALQNIFNKASKDYDYVAIAQEFISTKEEYRLVCAYGEYGLAYVRGNADGFNQQYWERGELATLITKQDLIDELYQFVKPIFPVFDIPWVGFDIIRAQDNSLYLIEMNSKPRFEHIMESNGEALIIKMYEQTLKRFFAKKSIII